MVSKGWKEALEHIGLFSELSDMCLTKAYLPGTLPDSALNILNAGESTTSLGS